MRWAVGARQRLAPVGSDPLPQRIADGKRWTGARHGLAPVGSDLLPGRSLLTRRFAAAAPATPRPPRQFGAARLAGVTDQSSRPARRPARAGGAPRAPSR